MQVYLASQETNRKWYLDSGCSRHMIDDEPQFIILDAEDRGMVTFGDNGKEKIIDMIILVSLPPSVLKIFY